MMKTGMAVGIMAVCAAVAAPSAQAHESKMVADGAFRLSVGFIVEPIHAGERNGLDLIIRRAGEREPVPGLEDGLRAELIAPDGESRREFPVRPQYGSPGRYTFDVMLTEAGEYRVRIWGTLADRPFDETFSIGDVRPLSDLAFP
jgi:hypothetical protein